MLKILYHPFITLIIYIGAINSTKYKKRIVVGGLQLYNSEMNNRKNKIGVLTIMVLALLQGIYNVICGPYGEFLADRNFYAIRFIHGTYSLSSSVGVYYIQNLLRNFSNNPYLFFFITGYIYLLLTFLAYNISSDAHPIVFLLLGTSQYFMYGCYQIKQSIATGFVAIAIACLLENKKKAAVLAIIAAISFHEVAWISVPIMVILSNSKSKLIRGITYVALAVLVFNFQETTRIITQIISSVIPGMSTQIAGYLDESGAFQSDNSNIMTILKGLPYYIISLTALIYRKELKAKMKNYNAYMLLSIFVSAMMALSAINYWFWRFGELLYLPDLIFAGQIYSRIENKTKKKYFMLLLVATLAIFTYRKLFMCYFQYGGII